MKKSFLIIVLFLMTLFVPVKGFAVNVNPPAAPFYRSKLAYAAEDGLYCTGLNDGKDIRLVAGRGISTPVFSSDGKAIAYLQNSTLYAYVFAESKARKLLENADSFCPGQSGGFYASSQRMGIIVVNPNTAENSTVIPAEKATTFLHLKLSPDSKYLAYDSVVSGVENQDKGGVWLYDTSAKKEKLVVKAIKTDNFLLGIRPSVGRWSPDSSKIIIWMMSQSASLSADGVGAAVYNVADGKLKDLNTCALAYDENVSFANSTSFALITGGGREMFTGKSLSIFDLSKSLSPKTIRVPDKVPTTPYYSPDGKTLVFAASPSVKSDDSYSMKMAAVSKRQIYLYKDGKLTTLTKDNSYRSEAPVFLRNGSQIVFARISINGEISVWTMESDGKNQKQLAGWKYNNPNDDRVTDFYGRIDWSRMFSVFDDSKGI